MDCEIEPNYRLVYSLTGQINQPSFKNTDLFFKKFQCELIATQFHKRLTY